MSLFGFCYSAGAVLGPAEQGHGTEESAPSRERVHVPMCVCRPPVTGCRLVPSRCRPKDERACASRRPPPTTGMFWLGRAAAAPKDRAKIQKRKIYHSIEWTRIFFHIPNSAYMSDYTGTTTPRLVACDACLVPAGDRRLESACALCRRCPARLLPRADLFASRLRPA